MRNYAQWLVDMEAELATAITEAEDLGWHHEKGETPGARAYARLLTWLSEIVTRRKWLDDTTRSNTRLW